MKIAYTNENTALIPAEEINDATKYDIKKVLEGIVATKTAKDLFTFLQDTPVSFFERSFYQEDGDVFIDDILCSKDEKLLGMRIEKMLSKFYPNIEYLDSLVVLSGDLGETYTYRHECPDGVVIETERVNFKGGFYFFALSVVERMVTEAKVLLTLAAVANGEDCEQLPIAYLGGKDEHVQIFDSGLHLLDEFNKTPIQEFETEELFLEVSNSEIKKGLDKVVPYKKDSGYVSEQGTAVFAFPGSWDKKTVAANIFTLFMNSLFEGGLENWLMGNNFKVKYENGSFSVIEKRLPMQDFYREIADVAAAKKIGICPHCGSPVLRTGSRGNKAQFCSNSCKTLETKKRREEAIKCAASGVPVESAISMIGERYSSSVEKWYEETLGTKPAR